jgi:multicomponent Na+:H+ antiporter subunit C
MSGLLALTAAALFGIGTWLLLQRRLSRIIIGVGLLGHGANLLLLLSGERGTPPFGDPPPEGIADPLPHAMALTAIVITFGITTFLLALAHRSWKITRDDVVEDDIEDTIVNRRSILDDPEVSDEVAAVSTPLGEEEGR